MANGVVEVPAIQDRPKSIAAWLVGTCYAAILISMWTVHSAPTDQRWLYTSLFVVLSWFVGIGAYGASLGPPADQPSSWNTDPRVARYVGLAMTFIFVLALAVATALTYGKPSSPILASLATGIISAGEWMFPTVAKFRSEMDLPETVLFKAQSVMTVFLLPALINGLIFVGYGLTVPSRERRLARENNPRGSLRPTAGAFIGLCLVPLLMIWFYLGFGQFDPDGSKFALGSKSCPLNAFCYLRGSDLDLFMSASMLAFFVAVVPGFVFLILDLAFEKQE